MKKILLSISLILTFNHFAFSQDSKMRTDWLFIYYMPYDNDLSKYGEPIIQMIKKSLKTDKVIVTVQADYADSLGMERIVISYDMIRRTKVENEYSAMSRTYREYLNWALNSIKYKKVAIVFLDHGGRLDELCLDEYPKRGYLRVDSLKSILREELGNNKVDLLFLQVCTKCSIEPIFEFKDIAKYTLCSQTILGAPNYYYHGLFNRLSNSPDISGEDVAKLIVKNEADNMYFSYTIINNNKLDSLRNLIDLFTNQIFNKTDIKLIDKPIYLDYEGERYCDLVSFLENIDLSSYPSLNIHRNQIVKFITNDIVLLHQINPKQPKMNNFSGLSMSCSPNGADYNNLYFYVLLKTFRQLLTKE